MYEELYDSLDCPSVRAYFLPSSTDLPRFCQKGAGKPDLLLPHERSVNWIDAPANLVATAGRLNGEAPRKLSSLTRRGTLFRLQTSNGQGSLLHDPALNPSRTTKKLRNRPMSFQITGPDAAPFRPFYEALRRGTRKSFALSVLIAGVEPRLSRSHRVHGRRAGRGFVASQLPPSAGRHALPSDPRHFRARMGRGAISRQGTRSRTFSEFARSRCAPSMPQAI